MRDLNSTFLTIGLLMLFMLFTATYMASAKATGDCLVVGTERTGQNNLFYLDIGKC